jgi:hypothetical protein
MFDSGSSGLHHKICTVTLIREAAKLDGGQFGASGKIEILATKYFGSIGPPYTSRY